MAAAGTGDGDGEKSTFRWLDAVRYAVAAVVTVLIVAVIVKAITVLLRPDSLFVMVIQGSVFASQLWQPAPAPAQLSLEFDVRAYNPSGRARMYYYNITVYLFDKDKPPSTTNPKIDSIIYESGALEDKAVENGRFVDYLTQLPASEDTMDPASFKRLYYKEPSIMNGVTMRLEGYLVTEIRSGYNTTPHWTTYYCGPLIMVRADKNDQAYQDMQDVICTQVKAKGSRRFI